MPAVRDAGADQLVHYLNTVSTLTDEPLRIIAYSHGCNLVKSASSHRELSGRVPTRYFKKCSVAATHLVTGISCKVSRVHKR